MMNPPMPDPNAGVPRELNLQKMASQFMAGLQRHFDMLAFNMAARETAREDVYNALMEQSRLMPVVQLHQNFEQMQAHARDLLLRQVVNDALNLTLTCLNNCHLFLALIQANKEHGSMTAEAQQAAQVRHNSFIHAGLNDKFDQLEKNYGVLCELEDSITSLAFCLQALLQNNGEVREAQTEGQPLLELELKCAPEGLTSSPALQPSLAASRALTFPLGGKVTFSDKDLLDIILTIAVFAQQLFYAVSRFGKENQPATEA